MPISNRNVIRQQSGNPLDYYDIIKKIGKGTFGTVYKVMHKKTGIIRAMKVIPKNNLRSFLNHEMALNSSNKAVEERNQWIKKWDISVVLLNERAVVQYKASY